MSTKPCNNKSVRKAPETRLGSIIKHEPSVKRNKLGKCYEKYKRVMFEEYERVIKELSAARAAIDVLVTRNIQLEIILQKEQPSGS